MHLDDVDLTVVIPSRLRPAGVARAVRSVLAGTRAPAQVVVVNQTPDTATAHAVAAIGDTRVRYLAAPSLGISAALNFGIANSDSEYIAITGDDCAATPGWAEVLGDQLASDPTVGLMFGSILPAPHDKIVGFVPSYERPAPVVASHVAQKHLVAGTSACVALRRSVWDRLGGFDELLGVGARFGSGEDTDFTIRALAAGFKVKEEPGARVVHHGFYTWSQRPQLLERNWYGTGAAVAKGLRLRHAGLWRLCINLALGWIRKRSLIADGLGNGSYRGTILRAFVRGLRDGVRAPLDRASGKFRPSDAGGSDPGPTSRVLPA